MKRQLTKATRSSKLSVAKLKKKAWTLFSIWIRKGAANVNGMVHCYTCNQYLHWKQVHAGHFVPGRHNSVLFDERNVHPQCYVCNVRMHGNVLVYRDNMVRDYGEQTVDDLRFKDRQLKQFTVQELTELIGSLNERISKL